MMIERGNLRIELSEKNSGQILNTRMIPLLKEDEYLVKLIPLDGDAPKQFIKAYFFTPDSSVKKSRSSSWNSFIAKTAEKWYPHESIIEFMINRIGQVLGLKMNEVKLVIANTQVRFLSKYFLADNEKLIHGAEICGEHLGDMLMAKQIAEDKPSARQLFTFEFIKDAIRSVFPDVFEELLQDLVKMLAFDAIVGNNDRHFYNWGVIDTMKKTSQLPTFAPIYDSARGLLWNWNDENIRVQLKAWKTGGKKISKYIDQASPRISIESNIKANHFELIDFLKRYSEEYKHIINNLADPLREAEVLAMLKREFYSLFIPERCELITLILKNRFDRIRRL